MQGQAPSDKVAAYAPEDLAGCRPAAVKLDQPAWAAEAAALIAAALEGDGSAAVMQAAAQLAELARGAQWTYLGLALALPRSDVLLCTPDLLTRPSTPHALRRAASCLAATVIQTQRPATVAVAGGRCVAVAGSTTPCPLLLCLPARQTACQL